MDGRNEKEKRIINLNCSFKIYIWYKNYSLSLENSFFLIYNILIMKFLKILSIFVLIFNIFFCFSIARESVNVYAEVGEVNSTPKILHLDPDLDILLIKKWTLQSFEFSVNDKENEMIYYTITADDGSVEPINWSLQWSGTVNFMYFAPQTFSGDTNLYITLNDSVNFFQKKLEFYIY